MGKKIIKYLGMKLTPKIDYLHNNFQPLLKKIPKKLEP